MLHFFNAISAMHRRFHGQLKLKYETKPGGIDAINITIRSNISLKIEVLK